jgi:GWxTD domain-containing protein
MERRTCACIIIALLISCVPAAAQVDIPTQVPPEYSSTLFLDPIAFLGTKPGESRLDVFVQVGYDNLSFVKTGDTYAASYEMTIGIDDSTGSQVLEKLWTENVGGLTFDQSVSSSGYSLQQRSFTLSPGPYAVHVSVRDLESKTEKKASFRCVVPDFSASLVALSDLMVVNRITVRDGRRSILPNVSPNVGNLSDAFYVFFEVYNRAGADSLRFEARVLDAKQEVVVRTDTTEFVKTGRNEVFMRIDNSQMPLGDYLLSIRAVPASIGRDAPNAEKEFIASRARTIIVRWKGLPRATKDMDLAIEQLEYIAKDNEMSDLKSAATLAEKQQKFLAFWKKRSPNPNAQRNEKMALYYARVEYANKHFTRYREGWRTDMGLVFILLGPPSNVERYPFQIDEKPEEVWQYYDLNYQFVFRDENGFGDYRLLTPLWEVYNRRRDF